MATQTSYIYLSFVNISYTDSGFNFFKLYLKFRKLESLYRGQFTLSTQLIKQNYLVILSTDVAPQFL